MLQWQGHTIDQNLNSQSYWEDFGEKITTFPVNTECNEHVIITSKLRFDVIITCLLQCVFARTHHRDEHGTDNYCTTVSYESEIYSCIVLPADKRTPQVVYYCKQHHNWERHFSKWQRSSHIKPAQSLAKRLVPTWCCCGCDIWSGRWYCKKIMQIIISKCWYTEHEYCHHYACRWLST